MSTIRSRLESRGLQLPEAPLVPPGVRLPFSWVRTLGDRVYVSGHVALNADGSLAAPFGKVGENLTIEEGYAAAQRTALAMLASLERELGDLERVTAWLRVLGMVNSGGAFRDYPAVINGFSDLIIDLFGEERGDHARSAVGLAGLPFDTPVEIEAEVAIQR